MKKAIVLFAFAVVCSGYALAQNDKDVPIIRMKDDTEISFSNGIAESIFIYYDDTYGDYYTLDTENKDTTYWNFLMKYNSYRFKQ